MTILGINAYHGDSSACLVRDGQLVAAAEEERFRRIKHWAGLPTEAIAFCLREGGVKLSDVDHVAVNRNPRVNNFRRLLFVLTKRPDFGLVMNRIRNIRKAAGIEVTLREAFPGETLRAPVQHIEHHLAHLASAFLVSDFDEAVCVSVDGFGDFASAAWGRGRGGEIQIDGRVYFPHSLGIFYSAITQLIGFPWFGDEYKVMGLAPYGQPKYLEQMRQVVLVQTDGTYCLNLKCFRHHNENVSYTWNNCTPEVGTLYTPELEKLLCPTRKKGEPLEQLHKDIARSAQAMYEEALFALLNTLHAKYRCDNLALSGGCAMNSVANGKVYLRSPFKKMYLPAAAGDAGGAIGAAFVVHSALATPHSALLGEQAHSESCCCGHTQPQPSSAAPLPLDSIPRSRERERVVEDRVRVVGAKDSQAGEGQGEVSNLTPTATPHSALYTPHLNGRFVMTHAYTGPQSSADEIEALLKSRGLLARGESDATLAHPTALLRVGRGEGGRSPDEVSSGSGEGREVRAAGKVPNPAAQPSTLNPQPSSDFTVTHFSNQDELCRATAKAISEGKVIGWFQGRMEWGPRALGNRSILGDPRRADMKDILNQKIKRRESFRPFAPSVLREHVAEWFEQDDDVPFMMQVFQVLPAKRSLLPAVCHVDGSGRLQTVHKETNPLYYLLISNFHLLTGVPMVLNTSFNENEPVVCKPEEALDCFLRTKMDVLVLGGQFISRR